jgi:opacity protein-like surface antigen
MRNQKFGKTFLAMLVALSTFNGAIANDESYLSNDPIDINGYVKEPAPATDQELEKVQRELESQKQTIQLNKTKAKRYKELGRTTEKLADATEELIEERNESQEEIDRYNKKISCLMGEIKGPECDEFVKNRDKQDEVSLAQAAPAKPAVVEEKAPAPKDPAAIKVLPYMGLTTFNGERENLEAEIATGVRVESDVSERFSIGMGLNYTTMKTTDFGSRNNYFTPGFNSVYNNYYNGREISYKNLQVDIYSKFFITKGERFRPYIGGGVAYNRTTMEYTDNRSLNPFSYGYGAYGYQFGEEELTTSNLTAQIQAGTEVVFTDNIGLNLELQYTRGLGSGFNTENGMNAFYAPDQQRLEDLNNEIREANILSVFAGLLVLF